MSLPQFIDLANLLFLALAINIPLGVLREETQKLSVLWFIYIHASIPFIVVLRNEAGYGWKLVPVTIICAILGQLIGGAWARRTIQKQ